MRVVEFTLAGQRCMAIEGGPLHPFNDAISFLVNCEDSGSSTASSKRSPPGVPSSGVRWLKDRHGVDWQIVPKALGQLMKDPDRVRVRRVAEAMLGMKKLDLGALLRAGAGT